MPDSSNVVLVRETSLPEALAVAVPVDSKVLQQEVVEIVAVALVEGADRMTDNG